MPSRVIYLEWLNRISSALLIKKYIVQWYEVERIELMSLIKQGKPPATNGAMPKFLSRPMRVRLTTGDMMRRSPPLLIFRCVPFPKRESDGSTKGWKPPWIESKDRVNFPANWMVSSKSVITSEVSAWVKQRNVQSGSISCRFTI